MLLGSALGVEDGATLGKSDGEIVGLELGRALGIALFVGAADGLCDNEG